MNVSDWANSVLDELEQHAEEIASDLVPFLLRLLVGLIIFTIIWKLGRFVESRVESALRSAGGNLGTSKLVAKGVFYSIALVAFAILLVFMGIGEAAVAVVLGVGVLAITLSLQDLFRNVVAGVYVAVERPVTIGSRVTIADHTGVIEDIGVRVTRMRGDDGSEILVPNLVFFTAPVTKLVEGPGEEPIVTGPERDEPATTG